MSYLAKIKMFSFKPAIILFLKEGYYGRKGHYHNDPERIKTVTYNQTSFRKEIEAN